MQCRKRRGSEQGQGGIRGVSPSALELSPGRRGLKFESDFASWKALGCSRSSQAFFKPEKWEGLREGGRERGRERKRALRGERARARGTEGEEERGSSGGDPANSLL